ncbi:chlorophyllide reductase [Mesorhizobium shangrilense]|uniref:Chlorophyllide reductase n=1 Tax=Mesorhizobium shangrilense TaxID=460060 RepID=A0ABV2DA79_9HYPH
MPSSDRKIAVAILGAVAASMLPFAAAALPSTAKGQVSVGQVMEMIAKADSSPIAKQTLIAYVAGVGEAAGVIVDTIGSGGSHLVSCKNSFRLDTGTVRAALQMAAPRQSSWSETPATPLIVADMVKRAGCRIKD